MPRGRFLKAYLGMVAFSLVGSALSRFTGLEPGPIAPAAALLTLLLGVAACFAPLWREGPRRPLAWGLLAVFVLGAASEILGLYTALPFGAYEYTDRWWPTVLLPGEKHYPLLLPFAWVLMAGASVLVVRQWVGSPGWAVFLGGLLAALVDLPMEAVMTGPLGYWRWLEPGPLPGGAPVSNFLGWWLVAALAGVALVPALRRNVETKAPLIVLAGHMVLMLGLALLAR